MRLVRAPAAESSGMGAAAWRAVVVDAPIGSVDADLVGADRDLDGVLERLRSVGVAGAVSVSVVSEAEEPKCFHATFNYVGRQGIPAVGASRVTRLRPSPLVPAPD